MSSSRRHDVWCRQLSLVVLCAMLGLLVGGVVAWTTRRGDYSVTAKVVFGSNGSTNPSSSAARVAAVRDIVSRPNVVAKVVANAAVRRDAATVTKRVRVSTARATREVQIRFEDPSPGVAIAIANALAAEVVNAREAAAVADLSTALAPLDRHIADLTDIRAAENGLVAAATDAVSRAQNPAERTADVANLQTTTAARDMTARQLDDANGQRARLLADHVHRSQAAITSPATRAKAPGIQWSVAVLGGAVAGLAFAELLIALAAIRPRGRHGAYEATATVMDPPSGRPEAAPSPRPAMPASSSIVPTPSPALWSGAPSWRPRALGGVPRLQPSVEPTPMAVNRLRPSERPPLTRGREATRLVSDRFRVSTEPLDEVTQVELRRIVDLSITDMPRAESEYKKLVAAQPSRRFDRGPFHVVTLSGMVAGFPQSKLDALWGSLVERGQILLTVPSLSASARDQLRRLGAQAEEQLGRSVTIFVWEMLANRRAVRR
jgi:hypothetical protein